MITLSQKKKKKILSYDYLCPPFQQREPGEAKQTSFNRYSWVLPDPQNWLLSLQIFSYHFLVPELPFFLTFQVSFP